MTDFLAALAERRRFGIRPGLENMRALCEALGHPERRLGRVIHVAGTNGKGAVCAMLDACLRELDGVKVGRYTSPHLVKLNERFFLNGAPIDDATLERHATRLSQLVDAESFPRQNKVDHFFLRRGKDSASTDLTFFEALTAVAFLAYSEAETDYTILETGLGGRLDATNVCEPSLCVITRIGLDHCDWLGDTVEKIASEKGGIIKPGVPVVLARNEPGVRAVIEKIAAERGAPFHYAPELADASELPPDFSLAGAFNRENAVTALAALKVLFQNDAARAPRPRRDDMWTRRPRRVVQDQTPLTRCLRGFSHVTWPGRFHFANGFLVDGAHNPPAATALASALAERWPGAKLPLVAGFCGDKDVVATLKILAPFVREGLAVRTNNPRSLTAEETAERMRAAGLAARPCDSLASALASVPPRADGLPRALVCGSLFLAGEALVALGAYPWGAPRFDPSELPRTQKGDQTC